MQTRESTFTMEDYRTMRAAAGYCYRRGEDPERARVRHALELARARTWLRDAAWDGRVSILWEIDTDADDGPAWGCVLTAGDQSVSLWGIDVENNSPYSEVVKAELALELRELLESRDAFAAAAREYAGAWFERRATAGGGFVDALFELCAVCDTRGLEQLRGAFPELVGAWIARRDGREPCVCGGTGNHDGQPIDYCDECRDGDWIAGEWTPKP